MTKGYQLPADAQSYAGQKAQGFATPTQDQAAQIATFLPKRVLPVIFIPGIMGSNLRITDVNRQNELDQKDNVAWRPDDLGLMTVGEASKIKPAHRQLRLDSATTAVDIYDPSGSSEVSGDGRHANVELADRFISPILTSDPPTKKNAKTAVQKARMRGWGEVFYKSYSEVLQRLESRLNNAFSDGQLNAVWHDVVGVEPRKWLLDPGFPQKPFLEEELKKLATGCWFPVHAMGYNWLQSNGKSAMLMAPRIAKVIDDYAQAGFECTQVILVTHSMGGLIARALIHPDYGGLKDKVLGVVHGVQPATGAAAAYKRIRAGFEDPGLSTNLASSIGAKVAGNYGDEVTAVLANSQGGLELLPSQAYGNGWLKVMHKGQTLASWPKDGDPYEEIYKVRDRWYSLIREEWINPAELPETVSGWKETVKKIERAKVFHQAISNTYHEQSFAHYGADSKEGRCFGDVVWEISNYCQDLKEWHLWPILGDTRQGRLDLVRWVSGEANQAFGKVPGAALPNPIQATIMPPTEAGDMTVPVRSADHQMHSGKFKAIFKQTGYEHQDSYKSQKALASTLYSILRIAQLAQWKTS